MGEFGRDGRNPRIQMLLQAWKQLHQNPPSMIESNLPSSLFLIQGLDDDNNEGKGWVGRMIYKENEVERVESEEIWFGEPNLGHIS